jgi:hypothetical protein
MPCLWREECEFSRRDNGRNCLAGRQDCAVEDCGARLAQHAIGRGRSGKTTELEKLRQTKIENLDAATVVQPKATSDRATIGRAVIVMRDRPLARRSRGASRVLLRGPAVRRYANSGTSCASRMLPAA